MSERQGIALAGHAENEPQDLGTEALAKDSKKSLAEVGERLEDRLQIGKPLELLDVIAAAGVPHTRQVYDTSAGLSAFNDTVGMPDCSLMRTDAHTAPTSHAEGSTEGTSLPQADSMIT